MARTAEDRNTCSPAFGCQPSDMIGVRVRDDHEVHVARGDAAGGKRFHEAPGRRAERAEFPGGLSPQPRVHKRDAPPRVNQQAVVGSGYLAGLIHRAFKRRDDLLRWYARSQVGGPVHRLAVGQDLTFNRANRKPLRSHELLPSVAPRAPPVSGAPSPDALPVAGLGARVSSWRRPGFAVPCLLESAAARAIPAPEPLSPSGLPADLS